MIEDYDSNQCTVLISYAFFAVLIAFILSVTRCEMRNQQLKYEMYRIDKGLDPTPPPTPPVEASGG